MVDLTLTKDEKVAALASSAWGVVALAVGVTMLMVALPSFDYIEGMKLQGYASAASIGQRSDQYANYQSGRVAWVQSKLARYGELVESQLSVSPIEKKLYQTRSAARSFFRRHIPDLSRPDPISKKPFLPFDSIKLDFTSLDRAFQTYCGYDNGSFCTADKPEAARVWDEMVQAQQAKELVAIDQAASREALATIKQAEADSLLTSMEVEDAESARRLLEAIGQWNSFRLLHPLFYLPMLIQYFVLAFCFGALGGYARYLAEIFRHGSTRMKRVGEVALSGAGAAFIVMVVSAAGFGIVSAGSGEGLIATNPVTVTALSLIAGVASESILSAVQSIGKRLFGGQDDQEKPDEEATEEPANPPVTP